MRTMRTFAAVAVFVMLGGVVSAHHSRAGYDNTKQVTMKGVVLEVKWRNPHVFMLYNVTDDKGTVTQWVGEMSSIATMLAAGMSKDSLKPGDEILVSVNPAQAGTPHGLIARLVRASDNHLLVGEGFRSETREQP